MSDYRLFSGMDLFHAVFVKLKLTNMKTLKHNGKKAGEPLEMTFQVGEVVSTYVRQIPIEEELKRVSGSKDGETILRKVWESGSMEYTESFYALYLNRANRVVGYALISKGGVSGTVADPKVIFKKALDLNASGIILSHNHPSGNLSPSQADIDLTRKLKEAAMLFEMKVLDHILLVPGSKYYSFADEGML